MYSRPLMPSPPPRNLLPLVLSITSTGVLTFTLLTPALPDLADALGVSRGSIGLIQGVAAFPGVLLAIFIGHIADVRGRRFVAVWSLLVFGVAGMAGFFLRSFWPLVAMRAVQGVGTSAILSLGVMVIGDSYTDVYQRRRALGLNGAALTAAGVVSPILGGYLASGGVFRPFLVFGIALPVAWWARRLPDPERVTETARPVQHIRAMFRTLRSAGRFSDFVGLLPFTTAMMIVFGGIGLTATPLFLEEVFDVASTGRGFIQAALSIGSAFAALSAARFARRFSPTTALTTAFAFIVTGFAVVAAAPHVGIVALGLWLIGSGVGVTFPLISDFVTSSAPGPYRGAAVGTWLASLRLGQTAGPIIGTLLVTGAGGRASFAIASGTFAALAILWRPLRRLARTRVGGSPDGLNDPLIP